jgi:hypothetical protein
MVLSFVGDLVQLIMSSKVIGGGLSDLSVMYPVSCSSINGCLGQDIGVGIGVGAGIGIGFVGVFVVAGAGAGCKGAGAFARDSLGDCFPHSMST